MKIAVCVKQVPDTATKIKLKSDSSGIDPAGVKWIISPYDEFAIEEALRIKEKDPSTVVTVYSVGPDRTQEAIRTALAMGADKGTQITAPDFLDNYCTAKALAAAISKDGGADLVLTGKEAVDDGSSQVAQFLGRALKLPSVTVVLKIEYSTNHIVIHREVEGGTIEKVHCPLPAIVAAQKGLNEPRYASLPNIMKAKKKEIQKTTLADLGVSEGDQLIKLNGFELPAAKPAGIKIEGDPATQAKELVRLLKDEAKAV